MGNEAPLSNTGKIFSGDFNTTAVFSVLVKKKVILSRLYSIKILRYSIIVGSIIIISLNFGIINNIYVILKILTSRDTPFEMALQDLNIKNYISSAEIDAEAGKNIIIITLESLERGYLS
ncbi:MAG: hypothetical protein M3512_09285 [Bacteroidota bacterium]|nr:hypothetical protein [Bacteroidota bacterium]